MRDYDDRSRKLARERYWEEHDKNEYECPDCERTIDEIEGTFEVHHKNGRVLDNKRENTVGLCRCCHRLREGKKPNKDIIRNLRDQAGSESQARHTDKVESVYLAGAMDYYNGEDSWWGSSLKDDKYRREGPVDWRRILHDIPLTVKSPRDVKFDHGADLVTGIAGADTKLVESSDSIIAYFSKKEQVGTLTELLHAVNSGKPALVLFNNAMMPRQNRRKTTVHVPHEENESSGRWKKCPVDQRAESPTYWFLINYLLGDQYLTDLDGSDWDGVAADVEIAAIDNAAEMESTVGSWIQSLSEKGWLK